MATLAGCIAKAGSALRPQDKSEILARARSLRASGSSVADSATQAVREQLEKVRAEIGTHRASTTPAAPAEQPVDRKEVENFTTPAAPEPVEIDLGKTVKHTTGKGKDIFGHVLQGATDLQARAIDPYTFNKDGGKFIRERHGNVLEAFLREHPEAKVVQPAEETASEQAPVETKPAPGSADEVVAYGRAMRAAGLEMDGIDPTMWSANVGERGEVHALFTRGRNGQPSVYSVRSMLDSKDHNTLATVKLADAVQRIADDRAELLAAEKPKHVAPATATDKQRELIDRLNVYERAKASAIARGANEQAAENLGMNNAGLTEEGARLARAVLDGKVIADQPTLAERVQAKKEAAPEKGTLTGHLETAIRSDAMPKDNPALRKLVEEFDGEKATPARMKQAQEALEAAIVRVARGIARFPGVRVRDQFDKLLALYQSQPNLNVRTSTSVENQAYSTPAPLAFLADKLARVTNDTTMYEPTAGTGMLTIVADPNKVIANEFNEDRIELLKGLGLAKVTQNDATKDVPALKVDRVVANPPFGPLPEKVKVDGYTIGQIDHLIAAKALEAMKDDGAATLIIGANKMPGGRSNQDLIFFNWLYSHYNVTSHFEVDGALYSRQGASWPVRVITIEGRKASDRISPEEGTIGRANTWDEVYERYEQGLAAGRAGRGVSTGVVSSTAAGPDVTGPVSEPSERQAAGDDRRGPEGGASGPANVAGQRSGPVGDSGGTTEERVGQRSGAERPGAGAAQSDQPAGNAGRPRADKPAGNSRVDGVESPLQPADNEFQVSYTPQSSRKDAGVLIPINMRTPTEQALRKLEDEVGDIDEFARRQMGYDSVEQMHEHLMGLQVDSVASAINQIGRGKATIIADQTGIGKGRQAAAIIRWALQKGHVPVFVSVKPSLFTDMFGDLHDIGSDDVQPFILNSTEVISGPNGERLFANKPSEHKRNLQGIAESGMLPKGRNALFMTYSQINVPNTQRSAVLAIAPRAVFILDESHNAGGDSATGSFMKDAIGAARGVVYLSATYAKRPDNMPLYFKTDIGEAISDDETLMNAMDMGGLPLQTVVSNNLVKAGQMFRRERSYEGVDIATVIDTKNRAEHEAMSDAATEALRAIVTADKLFHSIFVKNAQKEAKREAKNVRDDAGNAASKSINHTEFSSVVHNFVKQMLLGLEAGNAADRAIAMLQNGIKPLIAVENTMGSFLNEYTSDNNIKDGDSLGDFGYRNVLSRALDRTRYMTIQETNGDKTKVHIPLSQLDAVTRHAYKKAQDIIDDLSIPLPVSPIDWMRQRITKAGFSVAEITGRNLTVDYSNPADPKLAAIDLQEKKDKVRTTRMFNSGKLDAIILNVAGSTGISLHASEKFTDQRQRKMIVAQAAGDINIFMQMLGRIHRTGQVALPAYELLNADLPAVKRPTAVLAKKMKSLNANTSSNTESATSVKALDMLNKYGDQVVDQYLSDNPKLAMDLGLSPAELTEDEDGGANGREDIARKMTGRLALMPVERQRAVYADLEEQYSTLIDYLNKTNQNDLEPRTFDFDAREMGSQVLYEGTNPTTPFGEDAIYNEFSIKAQGKPMTPDEIRAEMAEHQGAARTGHEHARNLLDRLSKDFGDRWMKMLDDEQKQAANGIASKTRDFIERHPIGSAHRVEINGETYIGVVTNLRSTHKESGNPFSFSKVQVTLALNGALRNVTVPATAMERIETSNMRPSEFNLDRMFREGPKDERQTAKIITGNLLGAYSELKGVRGTIISFTKQDGTVEQGILLPKAFSVEQNTQGDHRFANGEEAAAFLRLSRNKDIGRFGIGTRDGLVRVTPTGDGGVRIAVPSSKAKGGKFFLDERLRAATGDFVTSGGKMVADVGPNDAAAAIEALMKKQALYSLPSMAEEARDIRASTQPQQPPPRPGMAAVQRITNPDRAHGNPQAKVSPTNARMKGTRTAAEWIAEHGEEPWVREVASKLVPYLDEDGVITYLRAGDKVALPTNIAAAFRKGGIFGLSDFDWLTGKSMLYARYDENNPVGQEDLLHELVHSATQRALSVTRSATIRAELESIRAVLQRTFDRVLTSPTATEQARNDAEFFRRVISDEHELLAYGMTSRTFRQWAQQLDASGRFIKHGQQTATLDQGPAPRLTLWQRFVDAVRALLGLSKVYSARLEQLLSRREADRIAFTTSNTPTTLLKRLDSLLQQTMDLRVGRDEYNEGWRPAAGTGFDTPIFYSALLRGMDGMGARVAPAAGWKQMVQSLVSKGTVKADEVQWSGINDWLDLQQGKVTKEQVTDFLRANGVRVEETTLGEPSGQDTFRARLNEMSDVELEDAFVEEGMDEGELEGMSREEIIHAIIASYEQDMGNGLNREDGVARYQQHTLPGGSNYREVLLTLPTRESATEEHRSFLARMRSQYPGTIAERNAAMTQAEREQLAQLGMRANAERDAPTYRSGHWDQPNVLAHIRLNDRTDADGKRVLFVEEIQSDWAQQGKKKGFQGPVPAKVDKLPDGWTVTRDNGQLMMRDQNGQWAGGRTLQSWDTDADMMRKAVESYNEMQASRARGDALPAAPFVGKTDAWVSLAIKRVVKMAVDEGYDRVAFVNGEQSADRYDLSKQVGMVSVHPERESGRWQIAIEGKDGQPLFRDVNGFSTHGQKSVTAQELEDLVGKEVAKNLLTGSEKINAGKSYEESKWYDSRPSDLKVGGEGMRAFYDQIVPKVAKDVVRKLGGDGLTQTTLEGVNTIGKGFEHLDQGAQTGFDITPKMREQVATRGVPQFGTAEFFTSVRGIDQTKARNAFMDAITSHASTNVWERTIGTQYAKAQDHPEFRPVFDAVQDYIKDTDVFANAAADQAPSILPKLEHLRDVWKNGLLKPNGAAREDIDAAGRAAFEGTLKWSRDESGALVDNDAAIERAAGMTSDQKARVLFRAGLVSEAELKRWQATPLDIYDGAVRNRYEQKLLRPGVVFSAAELRDLFKMSDAQIGLYREFRSAIDKSLDDLGRAELVRLGGTTGAAVRRQVMAADTLLEAEAVLTQHIDGIIEGQSSANSRDSLTELRNAIVDKSSQIARLKAEGYAPLMRFGDRTVTIRDADGNVEFFSMYESDSAANRAARELRDVYPRSEITQGRLSKEQYKLFQGLDVTALETFAEVTGQADNEIYQDFLRLAKSNRSALKRLITRKGIAGFNENTSRVLASFVTSNARLASGYLHLSEAKKAAAAIPNEMGDLKDEATKLVKYVESPGEEASAVRGLLFANFIGGSVASALVNLTQPFTMSLPYLGQFGGLANAGRHLIAATRLAGTGKFDAALTKIMHDNSDIVSPQEIHHLHKESQDRLSNHPMLQKAAFIWGSMFSLSEQFNRRVTFIAAINTAREQGMTDPVEFARKAVIETQGLYNKGNKPNWARGPIQATVMTFKQFSIHYLEFLRRMWKSGPEGKKAVATALAIMVLAAGAGGLPFADDLDDLIDTLAQAMGYNFQAKKAKRKFIASVLGDTAADFLTRGLSGIAGMPIDTSLRMGMGNLIPGTGLLLKSSTDHSRDLLEFAGAAGSLGQSVLNAGSAALSGDASKAMLAAAPIAIQNMAKALEMAQTGEYRNQKGQKVIATSPGDVAAKFLGFQPGQVAAESFKQGIEMRSIQLAKVREGEIAAKWAQGLNDNRPELQAEARAELADWNAKNPETPMRITMQQVISRVREMRLTRADRTTKAAPREMRAGVREDLSP